MARNQMERGDIFWVYLDPSFGREMGAYKERPVVVVSIADIHEKTRVVTVVPASTSWSTDQHVVFVKPDAANHLTQDSYFYFHQMRAIDQGRMTCNRVGRLSNRDMEKIEDAIGYCLGLPDSA
jgi:mRNA-degrading endonuclease toxin of MazEF toxin-antitoxin module